MVDIDRDENLTSGPPPFRNATEPDHVGREDGVAWRAARIILTRLVAEPSYSELDAGLRQAIERFLERHPAIPPSPE
jgi:hypothetical protein